MQIPAVINNSYAASVAFALVGGSLFLYGGNEGKILGLIIISLGIILAFWRIYIDNENAKSNREHQMYGQKI